MEPIRESVWRCNGCDQTVDNVELVAGKETCKCGGDFVECRAESQPLSAGLSKTYEFSTQEDTAKAMEMGRELYEFGRREAEALPSQLDFEVKTICQSIGEGYISTEEAKGYVRKAFAQGYLAAGSSPSQLERAARRIASHFGSSHYAETVAEILRSELGEAESPRQPSPDLLGTILKICSGEMEVDDGEDAEDALKWIERLIREAENPGPAPKEPK